jgi:hypothetical protein
VVIGGHRVVLKGGSGKSCDGSLGDWREQTPGESDKFPRATPNHEHLLSVTFAIDNTVQSSQSLDSSMTQSSPTIKQRAAWRAAPG